MAVTNPPTFLQAGTHTAEQTRRATGSIMNSKSGIVVSTDLAVTENGTPNMTLSVAAGRVWIKGSESSFQGMYFCESRATESVTVTAADATNPRKDLVVAKVQDSGYSGVADTWSLAVVAGTPAASPAEPSAPNNSFVLAMVDVPALDTAITNSQITDRRITTSGQGRAAALGGTIVATSSARPTSTEGQLIYETDTDLVKSYDGSAWNTVGFYTPLYARKTADESVTSSTTYQNDDELSLSVIANAVYEFRAMIIYEGATAGDIKTQWTMPTGATQYWVANDHPANATLATDSTDKGYIISTGASPVGSTSGAIGTGAANALVAVHTGLLVMGSTAGTFRLQWAQDTSSGTATKVKVGSFVTLQRIS